jgi:acyl carrier protein
MTGAEAARLNRLVATVLGISEVEAASATADNTSTWDSLGHLNLLMAIEQEFGLQFPAAAIPELDSVHRIREAIDLGDRSEVAR